MTELDPGVNPLCFLILGEGAAGWHSTVGCCASLPFFGHRTNCHESACAVAFVKEPGA